MSIKQAIQAWDGKSAADIQAVYDLYWETPDFPETIVRLSNEASLQNGATWLLKTWLKSGNILEEHQVRKIFNLLDKLEHWEAKLHILQCLDSMPINNSEHRKVHAFLMTTLTDSNIFVRAWAYNGFYELARQHPQYLDETKQFFEMAMRDEAASVKARIRNVMKRGF